MDFSQFLLNESYTLSPYKICVASFICSYLDQRNHVESTSITENTSNSGNVNIYGQLAYKLIMSMDCSFDELYHQINDSINDNSNSHLVLNLFNRTINRLRRLDVSQFYDFFDMIRSLIQGKFSLQDSEKRKNRMKLSENMDSDQSFIQIHKMSLVGIFLRKLIIHYEHLSYCEASTLFVQLQDYLPDSSNLNNKNAAKLDDINEESILNIENDQDDLKNNQIQDLISKINPKVIDELDSRLKLNKLNQSIDDDSIIYVQHLIQLVNKVKNQMKISDKTNRSKRKLSDLENLQQNDEQESESMELELSTPTIGAKRILTINKDSTPAASSSSAMDLDLTLNDDDNDAKDNNKNGNDMSLDRTLFFSNRKSKLFQEDSVLDIILDDHQTPMSLNKNRHLLTTTKQTKSSNKKRIYDTSQHYLVKQIYKIQFNEKSTPTPQQVMRYIHSKYAQHNSFYYFRFITFNYLANLNLIGDHNSLPNEFSLNNSGFMPFGFTDNRNNLNNNNQIANGLFTGNNIAMNNNGVSPGMNANAGSNNGISSSWTIDSSNKKYKSLFRAINFLNYIEYLKYNNALRVNNFTLARKYFFDYFDLKKPNFEPDSDYVSNNSIGRPWIYSNYFMNNSANNLPQRNETGNIGNGQNGGHHNRGPGDNINGSMITDSKSGRANLMLNSHSSNYCWSSLNLAMMYAHFRYYRLAYDALVDCISLAREKRDERCLQYAMLWILQISQHLDQSKTSKQIPGIKQNPNNSNHQKVYSDLNLMENIIGLILSSNPSRLPYISAKTFLHLYRVQYLKPNPFKSEQLSLSDAMEKSYGGRCPRPPFLPQSFFLAFNFNLLDVLGETFSTYSAILNAYGQTHLASLFAKLWLRLDVIETIIEEKIFLLDENTSIAIRNLAHYLWYIRGDHNKAIDLLKEFQQLYSSYNRKSKQILERALSELMFEYHLNRCEWKSAEKYLNLIRCIDRTRSYLMLAELKRRQNEPLISLECLDLIMAKPNNGKSQRCHSAISKLSGTPFFRENVFQTVHQDSDSCFNLDDEDVEEEEDSVVVKKKDDVRKKLPEKHDNNNNDADSINQRPIFLTNLKLNNLSFYERIQPPPPEELEPESERPLIPELDPYSSVECLLMRGIILKDLSILFECVSKSLSQGFKQLECRALIQIAKLQSETYGQHHNAINIIEAILHRIYSQGTLQDLSTAFYVYASIYFKMYCQGSLDKHHSMILNNLITELSIGNNQKDYLMTLKPASILIKRSILIREFIQDRNGLYESLKLAALIANEQDNLSERNFYSKRARIIRSTTME